MTPEIPSGSFLSVRGENSTSSAPIRLNYVHNDVINIGEDFSLFSKPHAS